MAAQTDTQVAATELERVRETVPVLFERESVFYSTVSKKDVEVVSARDMRVPLELRPGGAFALFDPEGGDMGRGSGATYEKGTISTHNFRFAVEWNTKVDWATNDRRKAVVNAVRKSLANAMADFRRHVDALCMTDGTGVLGTTSVIPANAGGLTTFTCAGTTDGFGVRLLRFGQPFTVYDTTLANVRVAASVGYTVDFYDPAAKVVKATAGSLYGSAASGDKIVVGGSTATPSVATFGIGYHHNDASSGTWMGLNRANYPEIRANRVTASGALALPFARLAVNKIGDRVGIDNGTKLVAWMHPCQVQAYEELGQMVALINKNAKDDPLNMYFSENMQLAGCPIRKSFSWNKTRIDFVSDVWGRAEMKPAGFHEVDGRKIFEVRGASGGVAAVQVFYLTASFNMFVDNPAKCAYISDLTIPSGY